MGIRSQNNPIAAYLDVFSRSGTDASGTGGGGGAGLTATGGIISDYTSGSDVYRAHIFTSSGTFDVSALGDFGDTIEYLVIAGGGSGGAQGAGAGGGGAGGLRTNLPGVQDAGGNPLTGSAFPVSTSPGSYTVTVGGGAAGAVGSGYGNNGFRGSNSVFGSITSTGGGGGGATNTGSNPEGPGGSGGGRGGREPGYAYTGNTPPVSPSQGNAGGIRDGDYFAGGGGGAGAVGSNGVNGTRGGAGGAGVQVAIAGPPTASPVGTPGPSGNGWFAGGGGGGSYPPNPIAAAGGAGGGGDSGKNSGHDGVNGTTSTGGGGGGATGDGPEGGAGGSGIVVVRYQIGELTAQAKASGGAISFYGGKTIHTFTSSGTFATAPNWSSATVDYLVVGGGGAGGSGGTGQFGGGGGGAGAVRIGTTPIGAHPVSTSIQVGAGGASAMNDRGGAGTDSYFGTPKTAAGGGGGGGKDPADPGGPGGSGGGAKHDGSTTSGGTGSGDDYPGSPPDASPSNGWGNDGGPGSSGGGGGGGGAGSTGSNSPGGYTGGPGGTGIQIPSTFYDPAKSTIGFPGASGVGWIAGGGGGSTYGNPNSGAGGGGGAAAGEPALGYAGAGWGQKNYSPGDPVQPLDHGNAKANSGSGGGGNNNGRISFEGGSGLVLIAYPT